MKNPIEMFVGPFHMDPQNLGNVLDAGGRYVIDTIPRANPARVSKADQKRAADILAYMNALHARAYPA